MGEKAGATGWGLRDRPHGAVRDRGGRGRSWMLSSKGKGGGGAEGGGRKGQRGKGRLASWALLGSTEDACRGGKQDLP